MKSMNVLLIALAIFAALIILTTAFLVGPQLIEIFKDAAREWAQIIEDAKGDE
jgi:hypothetical protein